MTAPTARLAWRPLQRSTRVAIIAALAATLFYQLFLLNPGYRGPVWLWVAMLLAEGLTAFHLVGTWWTILAHDDRAEPVDATVWRNRLRAGADVPPIDVFITAYGEDPALVRRTLVAARDMDLAHRTILLDDGDSDELRAVAEAEGVDYFRRPGGAHAKAGNVNAGLARTSGAYAVVFDADHVPDRSFLISVLPHFHDPDVAFVQSPQSYVNDVNLVATGSSEAQRIFYELVCPGKNHFNAAFCVGTNVMFRRAALDTIGGIWTGSNSEDIWTSLLLHERGWKSIYVPQVLARGLAPEDVPAYLKQQLRWASGGFEILARGRLFRRRTGLTIDQRLQYLFCGTHYLLSLAMLTFMLFPAVYLLFALSPIRADGFAWATHYLPFQAAVLLVTWLQSGGFRASAIVASIGAAPVHLRALGAVLTGRPAKWRATNAGGAGSRSLWAVMPLVALLILNVTAIVVGLLVMADPAPTWLSVAWASMIVLITGRMIVESVTGGRIRYRRAAPAAPRTPALSAQAWTAPASTVPALAAAVAGRAPVARGSVALAPDPSVPVVSGSATSVPVMSGPVTSAPATSGPVTSVPGASGSVTSVPGVSGSVTSVSATSGAVTSLPGASGSAVSGPGGPGPGSAGPEAAAPLAHDRALP